MTFRSRLVVDAVPDVKLLRYAFGIDVATACGLAEESPSFLEFLELDSKKSNLKLKIQDISRRYIEFGTGLATHGHFPPMRDEGRQTTALQDLRVGLGLSYLQTGRILGLPGRSVADIELYASSRPDHVLVEFWSLLVDWAYRRNRREERRVEARRHRVRQARKQVVAENKVFRELAEKKEHDEIMRLVYAPKLVEDEAIKAFQKYYEGA